MRTRLSLLPVLTLAAAAFFAAVRAAAPPKLSGAEWRFSVRYSPTVYRGPYAGRVYLFFTRRRPEPRFGPDWFRPEEFIARDVTNWKAEEPLHIFEHGQRHPGVSEAVQGGRPDRLPRPSRRPLQSVRAAGRRRTRQRLQRRRCRGNRERRPWATTLCHRQARPPAKVSGDIVAEGIDRSLQVAVEVSWPRRVAFRRRSSSGRL